MAVNYYISVAVRKICELGWVPWTLMSGSGRNFIDVVLTVDDEFIVGKGTDGRSYKVYFLGINYLRISDDDFPMIVLYNEIEDHVV